MKPKATTDDLTYGLYLAIVLIRGTVARGMNKNGARGERAVRLIEELNEICAQNENGTLIQAVRVWNDSLSPEDKKVAEFIFNSGGTVYHE